MGDGKKHHCPHQGCGMSFNRPYRLAQHLMVHNNIKSFACSVENCTKSYSSKSHLDRHINTVHFKQDNDVLYRCPSCFKTYSNRQNLKRHVKIHHLTKPRFCCDICKLEFNKKHLLTSHMYQHTAIKSFSCEICSADFVYLSEKKKHLRCHRTHSCPRCLLTFTQWSKLQKHLKLDHQGHEYICNDCGRNFKQRVHLVRHIKQHNTVKVFHCPYDNCNRFYSRNSNLRQHVSIKHEKILHECCLCGARICTKAKLDEHVLRIHSDNPAKRVYKTKEMGRKQRKDAGTYKLSTAIRLAGFLQQTLEEFEPSASTSNVYIHDTNETSEVNKPKPCGSKTCDTTTSNGPHQLVKPKLCGTNLGTSLNHHEETTSYANDHLNQKDKESDAKRKNETDIIESIKEGLCASVKLKEPYSYS